jgi:hypothetical protein
MYTSLKFHSVQFSLKRVVRDLRREAETKRNGDAGEVNMGFPIPYFPKIQNPGFPSQVPITPLKKGIPAKVSHLTSHLTGFPSKVTIHSN